MVKLKRFICITIFMSLIIGFLPNNHFEIFAENNSPEERYLYCKDVVAGSNFSIALKDDGTVVACGQNDCGQCTVPSELSNVKAIAAGSNHAVALTEYGTVVTWGSNYRAQCLVPSELGVVKDIAAGFAYTAALLDNGTVVVWGDNDYGQCNIPEGLSGITAIAAGKNHILALKEDGTVVAWGYNFYGQCTVPKELAGVVAISAGAIHSMALKEDGTVVAWGDNSVGQCSVPEDLSNVIDIDAGDYHSVALKQDGTVVAWGYNNNNQCAVPTGLSNIKHITAGDNFTIALKNNGTLVAWGDNSYNQYSFVENSGLVAIAAGRYHTLALKEDGTISTWISNEVHNSTDTVYSSLYINSEFAKTKFKAIAAGETFSLALKENGTVFAWGNNGQLQCDIPAGLNNVNAIAAGACHSAALKSDGTVVAWGSNELNQCDVPEGLANVKGIAAGGNNTAALMKDDTVVVWGSNDYNQCTIPDGLKDVKAIAVGDKHILALRKNGTVTAWGSNISGESSVPKELSGVKAISAGDSYSLALKEDGTIVVWGDYSWFQIESTLDLSGVKAISAGPDHIVALKESGSVMEDRPGTSCIVYFPATPVGTVSPSVKLNKWKKTYTAGGICLGLLDDDSLWEWCTLTDNSNMLKQDKFAVPVKMLENISDVSIGQGHILALSKDNLLWSWGTNSFGELGDGSDKDQLCPQVIMNDVIKIYTGKESTSSFAIKSDSSLWSWGNNEYGQLGDGTNISRNTPVKIMEGVKSVAVGPIHALAIKDDSSLWAWGYNGFGQLGNETYDNSNEPVRIMDEVDKIVVDHFTCFAIKNDYTLWTWGDNSLSKLGDGQFSINRNKPEMIMEDVSDVVPAPQSAFAITLDKSLYAWGDDTSVLFNAEMSEGSTLPSKLMDNITKVSANYHIMALDENGSLWVWGYDDYFRPVFTPARTVKAPELISDNVDTNPKLSSEAISITPKLTPDSVNIAPKLLSYGVTDIATDYNFSSYIKSDGSLFQLSQSTDGSIPTPKNISVQPYIDNIYFCSNFLVMHFGGAPLDTVIETDFAISSLETFTTGEAVTSNVYGKVSEIDPYNNKVTIKLQEISYDFETLSFNVSYKGQLEVNAPVDKTDEATTPTSGAFSTSEPTSYSTPQSTSYSTPEPTSYSTPEPTPYSTPEPTPYSTPEPTPYSTPEPTPYSTPEPTPYSTPEPTPYSTPEPTPYSTPEPTPSSTTKSTYQSKPSKNSKSATVVAPTEIIPGPVPQETPANKDIEYNKIMQDFKQDVIEILKKYGPVDYQSSTNDPYNENGELFTSAIEKTIEKAASKIIIPEKDSVEINQDLISPQCELALKAYKDIDDFLKTQSYQPIRVIRKRINIYIDLTGKQLNITLLKDIAALMENGIDLKISSKYGNIILNYENIQSLLKNNLTISLTDENDMTNTKIKSKVNLQFMYSDGTILERLDSNIKLELPYGDGNPDYCTIYNELDGNFYASTLNKFKMQYPKIELAFPRQSVKSEYSAQYSKSTTKGRNMGGHIDIETKTLSVSTANTGKYYVVEERITFDDIKNEDNAIKEAIEVLASKGIISGRGDGSFHPDEQLNRSEFACLIVRSLNIIDEDASANFKDVKETAWYYNAVSIAYKEGLISGYGDNTFQGSQKIKRQEIITVCSNTLNSKKGYSFPDIAVWLNFTDKATIPVWARKFIALGNREGLIVKRSDGKFNGTGYCTRRDVAIILYRLYKKL